MKWLWPLILGGLIMGIFMGNRFINPIEKMAKAIMEFEAGPVSERNNNPGNLKYAGQAGAYAQDEQGHAIFDSFESGWKALITQLELAFEGRSQIYSPDDTLYDFFSKYAERNSQPYAEFVAQALGVSPYISLSQLI